MCVWVFKNRFSTFFHPLVIKMVSQKEHKHLLLRLRLSELYGSIWNVPFGPVGVLIKKPDKNLSPVRGAVCCHAVTRRGGEGGGVQQTYLPHMTVCRNPGSALGWRLIKRIQSPGEKTWLWNIIQAWPYRDSFKFLCFSDFTSHDYGIGWIKTITFLLKL